MTWIAVDWGTTALRAHAMTPEGPVDLGRLPRGMNALAPAEFEPALLEILALKGLVDLSAPVSVLACGMVGARQGWAEAPYRRLPCPPLGPGLIRAPTRHPGLSVHIVPGLAQDEPPDVMRGEETQIAGFLALNPGWDGVLCLPGTHSKWAAVSAGAVTGFRTLLTGELFALLSTQSVLRHSLPGGADAEDEAAFTEAVAEAMTSPEQLPARLFAIRARDLLAGQDPARGRAHLSGLLIGAELAAMRGWWLGNRLGLIASGALGRAYARALAAQGARPETMEMEAATLAGLTAARSFL